MNYNHAFHAGNFADVFKHVLLIALLESLSRKSTPFCYIDTHAGAGFYDLTAYAAQKSKEYLTGIEKIINQTDPTPLIQTYLQAIHQINNQLCHNHYASLQYYPGSPLLAKYFLRAHDRMVACELESNAYRQLKSAFNDKRVAVHHVDGWLAFKAFLPPKENRGLILIDPPYENPDEFTHIINSLPIARQRFPNGIYAIWYPIKEQKNIARFHQNLIQKISQPVLSVELTIYPDLPHHLNGSGVLIINPPFQFEDTIKETGAWLWKSLTINHQGAFSAKHLK